MTETTRTSWGLVAFLFGVGLLAAMQFIKVSLTLDLLAEHYERPVETISFLVTMVSIVGMALGVVAGALVAWLGTRPVVLGALVLGGLVSFAGALLPPFPVMLGLRAIEGLSHLAIVVAVPPTMALAATPSDRPVVMSIWAMFFGVAFSLGALIFPPLLAMGGVPALFVAHGIGFVLLLSALMFLLPPARGEPTNIAFFRAHREAYSSAPLAGPALVFLIYTLLFVASVTFLPPALGRPELAAILPLISLAGTLAAGWLCRTIPPGRVMALGYLCFVLGALPLPFGAWWASYIVFVGMGLVPGACFAAIPAWNSTSGDQARATGAIAQMGNVGTGTGTPLFAFALAMMGTSGLWILLIAFPIAALLIVRAVSTRIS
ncbi:MAG: MFS transporter [Rhodobacteraceae bacterium]|nr:MFS transporter [Paracoccaceae bacterium]